MARFSNHVPTSGSWKTVDMGFWAAAEAAAAMRVIRRILDGVGRSVCSGVEEGVGIRF